MQSHSKQKTNSKEREEKKTVGCYGNDRHLGLKISKEKDKGTYGKICRCRSHNYQFCLIVIFYL